VETVTLDDGEGVAGALALLLGLAVGDGVVVDAGEVVAVGVGTLEVEGGSLIKALSDTLGVSLGVREWLAPTESGGVAEAELLAVRVADDELLTVLLLVRLGVSEVEELADGVCVPVGDPVALVEAVTLELSEILGLILALAPSVTESVAELDSDALRVDVDDGVSDEVPVSDLVPAPVFVCEGDAVGIAAPLADVVALALDESAGESVGVAVGDAPTAAGVGVGEAMAAAVAGGDTVSDGVGGGVDDSEPLGVGVAEGVSLGIGELVGDGGKVTETVAGFAQPASSATAGSTEQFSRRTSLKPAPLLHSGTRIAPSVGRIVSMFGLIKDASGPSPSPFDMVPLPASVLTLPQSVTARTRAPNVSLTTRTPRAAHHVMPRGVLKSALVPTPSLKPGAPAAPLGPASVVTVAVDTSIARTRCDVASVTYSMLPTSARPDGLLSFAPTPTPSAVPAEPHVPAKVVVIDVANVYSRTQWLPRAAMYRLVGAPVTARPYGCKK
jgi:hypothetical protein